MSAKKNCNDPQMKLGEDKMKLMNIFIVALLVIGIAVPNAVGGQSSSRAVAMGGAYTSLATGVDAARYNPANLGLTDYRATSIELVGVGANITNNSFSLSDYNKYSGAILTTDDKEYILGQIPTEGLKLSVEAEAAAMSVASGPFAFSVIGVGLANMNLSKDIFELIMNGNTYADTIDVTGSYSEALSYVSAGLSYGRPVYNSGSRQLAVGATFKYIRGLANEEVLELEGIASTETNGFFGEGNMVARTASGGTGFALDLGAALILNKDYTVGVNFSNIISKVNWTNNAQEFGYEFSFDTATIDNWSSDQIVSNDYTTDLTSYSTGLPSTMTIGFAKRSGKFHWSVDWEQGFSRTAGSSSKPRISAGVESTKLGFMPLRAGYSLGGDKSAAFSIGSGLYLSKFHIDYAVVSGSSLSGYSSKGLNLAVSTGLYF